MKVIVEHAIGGDGAKALLAIEGADLVGKVTFPLAKVVEPLASIVDKALDKLEAIIPGDWDKAPIERIKAEARHELVALLSE